MPERGWDNFIWCQAIFVTVLLDAAQGTCENFISNIETGAMAFLSRGREGKDTQHTGIEIGIQTQTQTGVQTQT